MDVTVDGGDLLQVMLLAGEHKTPAVEGALKRVVDAYNQAGRKPLPDEPTPEELKVMREHFGTDERRLITVGPKFLLEHRSLLSNDWVEFGSRNEQINWQSSGETEHFRDPRLWCRLTPRGRLALAHDQIVEQGRAIDGP